MRGFRWPRELLAALLLCIACARPSSPPPTPTSSSDSTGRSPSEAEASSADVPAPTSGTNAATGDAPDGTTEVDRGTTTGWPEATTSEASTTTTGDAPPDTSTSGRDEPGETSIATDASTTSPFPDHVTRPRILIVGDSISAGPGCYKGHLRSRLVENGYSDFEFVGPYDDDCGGGVRHGAVSCSTAEQYTQPTFTTPNCGRDSYPGMASLVESHTPDLVMLQLGVNDLWSGRPPESILESYTTLLQQARQHNPNIVMVVARIAKIRPDCTNEAVTASAQTLVDAVPDWAITHATPTSPVYVADLWTDSDWSMAETIDCVHPNDVGAANMGDRWYEALAGILPQ